MLSTRLLPPQFLLPAWSSRQLARAAQKAHKSDYTRGNQDNRDPNNKPEHQPAHKRAQTGRNFGKNSDITKVKVEVEIGLNPRQATCNKQLDQDRVHGSKGASPDSAGGDRTPLRRRFITHPGGGYKYYGPANPQRDVKTVLKTPSSPEQKVETPHTDQEKLPGSEEKLSLFEELFPEEALARHNREKKARERLEKLPAFNWAVETEEPNGRDRPRENARQQSSERYQTVPGLKSGQRTSQTAKEVPKNWSTHSSSEWLGHLQARQDESRRTRSRASVLVLKACSKTLEESDFYRVGPQGNHLESWTSGILKVIPARDSVTLEPLGQYFLLFSSLSAARLYLDKSLRLVRLVKSSDYFSRPGSLLRDEEDLDAVKRNFTLVPAGGILSLRLLEPPFSKGLQWMIDAGGPAPLVARQSKSQNIVLFSTDQGHVKDYELENAILDDGNRRNLHWKLAGAGSESIVKLHSRANTAGRDDDTSIYRGPARYTVSFKDSNEARRFTREWHRRPFPSKRSSQPGHDAPVVNAVILW